MVVLLTYPPSYKLLDLIFGLGNTTGHCISCYCDVVVTTLIYLSKLKICNCIHSRFLGNSDIQERGFNISYAKMCGGSYQHNGELMSPGFPNAAGNYECIYKIAQSKWAATKIEIDHFDIWERVDGCESSFLEVRDGNNETSPLMGKFCGRLTDIPSSLTSTQNEVWIR